MNIREFWVGTSCDNQLAPAASKLIIVYHGHLIIIIIIIMFVVVVLVDVLMAGRPHLLIRLERISARRIGKCLISLAKLEWQQTYVDNSR